MYLRQLRNVLRQTGLMTGRGVAVDDPLVDHLVDERDGRVEKLSAAGLVAAAKGGAKLFDLRAQFAAACAVDRVAFFILADSLFC